MPVWIPPDSDFALALREPNLLVPGRKPVGPVDIDWSNPLSRGLSHFFIFNGGEAVDLVTGRIATRYGNVFWDAANNGFSFDESGDYLIFSGVRITEAHTLLFNANYADISGDLFQYIISTGSYGATNSINLYIHEEAVTGGFSGKYRYLSGNVVSTYNTSTEEFPTINNKAVALRRKNATGSGVDWFFGGQSDAGSLEGSEFGLVNGSLTTLYIGARGDIDASRMFGGVLKYLAIYGDRALSDAEVTAFQFNEYQLLKPANDTPYLFPVAAAGGGVSGTGDLVGAGSEVTGTGERTITGTGALEGQGAAIVGTGERVITGTGALIGQGSDVAGTGATGSVHTGTGDLIGAGSEVVGVGERTITGTGVLVAQGSAVVGVGERTVTGSGDLVGAGAEVSGSGAVGGITTGTGDLVGAGSEIVGTGIRTVTGSGALVAQGSAVTGTGERTIIGAGALVGSGSEIVGAGVGGDVKTGAGALVGQGSAVTGTGTRKITGVGELVAAGSIIVGAGARTITGSGALVGAGSEVVGRQASHDFAAGNTNTWMLDPRGRVWSLENRDPYDAHKRGREVCS